MNNEILKEVSIRVSQANNVLVAVSSNPSVDELSAAVGLTLFLNKLGKHATTVFSGIVPSTLEFLQPEQAIEKTTDSLRDFIIALDKSKADKLRYKVEDDVVRIFITPYKTTITDADLQFSLGEFNVDVVIAVGISRREDVDQAVTAHGRILHDATVLALTNKENSDFGAINWNEPQASSLSEMVSAIAYELSSEKIDGQMATALLTGIIAETDRFRNQRTTPMSLDFASRLMRAGANQQLIADELEAAVKLQQTNAMDAAEELPQPHDTYSVPMPLDHKEEEDGSLQIEHQEEASEGLDDPNVENIEIDHHGNLSSADASVPQPEQPFTESSDTHEQPTNTYLQQPEQPQVEESSFGLGSPNQAEDEGHDQQIMTHGKTINPISEPEFPTSSDQPFDAQKAIAEMEADQSTSVPTPIVAEQSSAPVDPVQDEQPVPEQLQPDVSQIPAPIVDETPAPEPEKPHEQTLQDLEEAVNSPHLTQQTPENISPQHVDVSAVPKPLTDEDEQSPDAPPPVPPPMQPQYFDNNSSGQ